MDNQSTTGTASGSGSGASKTPEKSNTRLPLPEGANETIVTAYHLRMNPVRQLGLGGVNIPPPQTCRKIFDKRYYIQQVTNHMIVIDKEINRLYDQLMHHKLQSTNMEFVEKKVAELTKQFEEKEEHLKILNDVVRLHYLHKGKPIDVTKNITMLRKANKERMENMEKIQFFDKKDLERVSEKLRVELEQEDRLKKKLIEELSIDDKEELEELTFEKDEMIFEKEHIDGELDAVRSDIARFEAKMNRDPKMEAKYKLRALIHEAPEIAQKYKQENKDYEAFEKQGKVIRIEIETLGALIEKLEDDMNTDYSDQNRRLAKFREFQRRERIIENFLQNYSNIARDTFDKLSDLQGRIVYSLEYLSATDEEKDPLWDPEEYEYYVNPNLQKDAVIQIIIKLQKQYIWFRHTLNQFRTEINELLKLKRTYSDEIEVFTNYEDIRDEMIDRQNELATLKTSLTRSLESTSAAIVEATGNRQTVEKKIQLNPAYALFQELQAKLTRLEEKNQRLKDSIDKVVFGAEVAPIKKECLDDMEELKADIVERAEENLSFMDVVSRQVAEANAAKESNEPYPIDQIRFFKCGALDPNTNRMEGVKKSTPSSTKTTPAEGKGSAKKSHKKRKKYLYYSDDSSSSSSSTNNSEEQRTPPNEETAERKERLSSVRKDLRKEFNAANDKKEDEEKKTGAIQGHLTSIKKDLTQEFEMMTIEDPEEKPSELLPVTSSESPVEKIHISPQPQVPSSQGHSYSKDSRIKTTVLTEKPQGKSIYRRFSAYGVNIRDQQPDDSDDSDDNSIEQKIAMERIDTLSVEHSPEILKPASLSPVREESDKPDETDTDSGRSGDTREIIKKDVISDEAKPPSEGSDTEVIKIEFHRPDEQLPEGYEEGQNDQKSNRSKEETEFLEKPPENVEDPSKITYKGFTICVKEAQECSGGIKSPGSARSSAIDDIVSEFALHSKENSESEISNRDSNESSGESEKSEEEIEERAKPIEKEIAANSGSASPTTSQPTYGMDDHISLIKDELKEEFGEVKLKKRFTHVVKFADEEVKVEPVKSEVQSQEEEVEAEGEVESEVEEEEEEVEEEEEEEEEEVEEEEPIIKVEAEAANVSEVSLKGETSKAETDVEETASDSPASPIAAGTPTVGSVFGITPSTSPDLEPTPPISPTSSKPPITTPEMDSSSTSPEMNGSPLQTPILQISPPKPHESSSSDS